MYAIGFKINSKGIDKADEQVQSLSSSFTAAGVAAGIAVAAVAGFGAAAISAAGQYESAMSGLQMATGASAAQMEETRGIAKELYEQNFGESWDDLGGAIASVQQVTGQTGGALQADDQGRAPHARCVWLRGRRIRPFGRYDDATIRYHV